MTTTAQRQNIVSLIDHACKSGARMHIGCKQIGLACRTLQRWLRPHAKPVSDALAPESAQQQQEPQASVEAAPTLAHAPELAPAIGGCQTSVC